MEKSKERELIETWFERVWKQEETAAIDEMFAGGKITGLGYQSHMSPADFKQFHSAMCSQICDIDIAIDKCLQDGAWLSVLCTLTAKCQKSAKDISMTGNVWVRIEDGMIREAYNHFDFVSFWEQLGYLPSGSFAKGLQGQKIA